MKINFQRYGTVYESLLMTSESLADAAKLVELNGEMQGAANVRPVLQTTIPSRLASAVPFVPPKLEQLEGVALTVKFNTASLSGDAPKELPRTRAKKRKLRKSRKSRK